MIVRINARRWSEPIIAEAETITLTQQRDGRVAFFADGKTAPSLFLTLQRAADETIEVFGSAWDMAEHDKTDPPQNVTCGVGWPD